MVSANEKGATAHKQDLRGVIKFWLNGITEF